MRKYSILSARSEQCSANTGLQRICTKTKSNTSCYTNSGSNSNLNYRLHDAVRPSVNNNGNECSIPGPSTVTNTNNYRNSNLNNTTDNTPLSNNNKIKYFLPVPSKESNKKACTEITNQLQKEFVDVLTGIGCFDVMFSLQVKLDSKPYQVPKSMYYMHYRKCL